MKNKPIKVYVVKDMDYYDVSSNIINIYLTPERAYQSCLKYLKDMKINDKPKEEDDVILEVIKSGICVVVESGLMEIELTIETAYLQQ